MAFYHISSLMEDYQNCINRFVLYCMIKCHIYHLALSLLSDLAMYYVCLSVFIYKLMFREVVTTRDKCLTLRYKWDCITYSYMCVDCVTFA